MIKANEIIKNRYQYNIINIYILISVILFFPPLAKADYAISAKEIMLLPPFCRGLSIGNYSEDAQQFHQNIKVPGSHTHHFCHGMKFILRNDYQYALNEFEYVEGHSTSDNVMLTYNALYKGYAYENLGKTQKALEYYNKAINLNPKNVKAYKMLSSFYKKSGQNDNAIETLKKGLEAVPNSKNLKKRLEKLQGKNSSTKQSNKSEPESDNNTTIKK